MNNNKFYHFLKIIFKSKWIFSPPPNKEIVIFDHGFDQLSFLEKEKCLILSTRNEEFNLYILLKTIFIKGFNNLKKNYLFQYLNRVNPKFVITYRCDNKYFYEIKKNLKNPKTILIQWGKTIKEYFKNFDKKNGDFYVDEMYLYGEETAKIFSNNIKGKTYSIGSIANNRFNFENIFEKNTLIFVSQVKSNRIFPEIEKQILKLLKNYCQKHNLKFLVSTRVLESDLEGKKEYENILGLKGWSYCPRKSLNSDGDYYAYSKVMKSEFVVFIDSTLGYEALSRKKKVAVFPLGAFSKEYSEKNYILNEKTKEFYMPSKFGFPLELNNEGEFWVSHYDEKKIIEKLNFILKVNNEEWLKLLDKIQLDKIIKFDLNNRILLNNLGRLGVPLQPDNLVL